MVARRPPPGTARSQTVGVSGLCLSPRTGGQACLGSSGHTLAVGVDDDDRFLRTLFGLARAER